MYLGAPCFLYIAPGTGVPSAWPALSPFSPHFISFPATFDLKKVMFDSMSLQPQCLFSLTGQSPGGDMGDSLQGGRSGLPTRQIVSLLSRQAFPFWSFKQVIAGKKVCIAENC